MIAFLKFSRKIWISAEQHDLFYRSAAVAFFLVFSLPPLALVLVVLATLLPLDRVLAETDTSPSSRHIPAAVRRAVHERDAGRCTYVDAHGRRCKAHDRLEFHHHEPFGRGGDHSPENLAIMCATHNALLAERDYGKEVMGRYRRSGTRVSEAAAVYSVGYRAARRRARPSA